MPNDGNAVAKADSLPFTYKSFMAQEELKAIKGQANANNLALNVYRKGDFVYLEIPRKALGKDILALAMSYKGSNYLSPVSGLLKIKEASTSTRSTSPTTAASTRKPTPLTPRLNMLL